METGTITVRSKTGVGTETEQTRRIREERQQQLWLRLQAATLIEEVTARMLRLLYLPLLLLQSLL